MKFLKLWDLSEYVERTMHVQEAYLPKMSISGQIVSEMLAGYTQKTAYKPF